MNDKDKHMKEMLASRSAKIIIRTPKGDKTGQADFSKMTID